MGRTPKVLCAVGALFAAGLHAAPAEAAPAFPVVAKNCSTKADGTTLRVKLRATMARSGDQNYVRDLRVRVSHPDGVGKFRKARVRSVASTLIFESEAVDDRIGSAAWAERRGDRPVYNKRLRAEMGSITAVVQFRLKNGERAVVACTKQFPRD